VSVGPSGIDHIDKLFGPFDLGSGVERYLAALAERRALARQTQSTLHTRSCFV